jgi:hypothetical protein
LAALLLAALACAGAGAPARSSDPRAPSAAVPTGPAAKAGLEAWLKGDAQVASERFHAALAASPGDASALLGQALLARRGLDADAEATALLDLLDRAPTHPLTVPAIGRLSELAELSPALARVIGARLTTLVGRGPLRGMAANRARNLLTALAETTGEVETAARLRAENGLVQAWAFAGPCGAYHALEFDRRFPPEAGPLPARFPGPTGLPDVEPRPFPVPDGLVTFEGEPASGDIYYLASDVQTARGGPHLLTVKATASVKVWLDGTPMAERRAFAGHAPMILAAPISLAAGRHRLLVKVSRGGLPAAVVASFSRADGAASDVTSSAAVAGAPAPAVREGPPREPAWSAQRLSAQLEPELGPVLARLMAARDGLDWDREGAKALIEEALARAPRSAPLLATQGDLLRDDPTLGDKTARARAEAAYDQALSRDPGSAAERMKRAELMQTGERYDDALALLAGMPPGALTAPRVLTLRARIAWARGFAEEAEQLSEQAWTTAGLCQSGELLLATTRRRDAVAREDELAEALLPCHGGVQRLANHRRKRGDAAGEAAVLERLFRTAPTRIEPRLDQARIAIARGDAAGAASTLAELIRFWPRDPRLQKRRAEALELAGDRAGARAARELALRLDGSDLGLRRAVALTNGQEVLAQHAEDGAAAIRAYEAAKVKPDTSSAVVLDAAAIEFYPDGSSTERIHQIIQVLDQRGIDHQGEVSIPSGSEVLAVRTIKKDGRRLEPEDVGDKGTLSLPGLEPGDYVEYEYLHPTSARGPGIPGFTAPIFYFQVADAPLFRSTYVVIAPKGSGLVAEAHNMLAPTVKVEGNREVLRVERTAVPALIDEPESPGATEFLPLVVAGAGAGREAMQRAIADSMVERFRPTIEIAALARRIAAESAHPAETLTPAEALVRNAYARVTELVLGQGGSWGESAAQVLANGRGNRTILLRSVFAALGVKARLALVRTFGADPAEYRFYRPELYGYAVLRVEHGGKVYWLDPGTRLNPFGNLPEAARGCEALILPDPGEEPEVVRTPMDGIEDGREIALQLSVDEEGGGTVDGVEQYLGFEGAAAKASIESLDKAARRQLLEQSLAQTFRGLSLESFAVEGEQSAGAPLTIRYRLRVPQLLHAQDGTWVLDGSVFPSRLGARYLTRAARKVPLLLAGNERVHIHLTISGPEVRALRPGGDAHVTGAFGSYDRVERREGSVAVRDDRFMLRRGRLKPSEYADFARFAGSVDDAQAVPMIFGP